MTLLFQYFKKLTVNKFYWLAGPLLYQFLFLLMFAEHWWMMIVANIFIGINQGLAWSSAVIMKVDLVSSECAAQINH